MASDAVRLAETLKTEAAKIGAQVRRQDPGRPAQGRRRRRRRRQVRRRREARRRRRDRRAQGPGELARLRQCRDQGRRRAGQTTAGTSSRRARPPPTPPTSARRRPDAQAEALATLGDLLARHSAWRGALDAYKASLDRRDNLDVRKTYESLREQYGFRILDYKVDNESTNPRVCFTFSEQLARKTDFAPYVAVSGASNTAISNEDQQICVEGLKHGERYAIVLRQGLPSAVGENLLKAADYEIYVRDRSPQAHFAGKAYVLPREGQEGAPLVTVNTAKVAVDVYRIGDRNLLATVNRDDFLKTHRHVPRPGHRRPGRPEGVERLDGRRERAQQGRGDRIPDPQGGRQARSRRLSRHRAAVEGEDARRPTSRTTRSSRRSGWSSPTSASPPSPATTACTRSSSRSGSAGPGRGRRAEARRAQQRGARGQDHRRRRAGGLRSGPLARQGRLGARASSSRRSAGDYNFLNLAQNAFDLTDRGVGGRDAPAGLDAFLYTERGVYRSGETVFATALLRDAKGVARAGLPLTLVVKRPDGVEYKRATVARRGSRRARLRRPAAAGLGAGKWSIEAYADPKGDPIGAVEFLLEDYIPERLDFTLKPAKAVHRARRADRALARRALPLRRAGERPRRHRRDPPAGGRGRRARRASPAMSPASPTTSSPPSRPSSPTR